MAECGGRRPIEVGATGRLDGSERAHRRFAVRPRPCVRLLARGRRRRRRATSAAREFKFQSARRMNRYPLRVAAERLDEGIRDMTLGKHGRFDESCVR